MERLVVPEGSVVEGTESPERHVADQPPEQDEFHFERQVRGGASRHLRRHHRAQSRQMAQSGSFLALDEAYQSQPKHDKRVERADESSVILKHVAFDLHSEIDKNPKKWISRLRDFFRKPYLGFDLRNASCPSGLV